MKRANSIVIKCIAVIICIICMSTLCYAHSGRTDSQGGHTDHSTGEYHFHHGYSAHQHPGGICPYTSSVSSSSSSSGSSKNNSSSSTSTSSGKNSSSVSSGSLKIQSTTVKPISNKTSAIDLPETKKLTWANTPETTNNIATVSYSATSNLKPTSSYSVIEKQNTSAAEHTYSDSSDGIFIFFGALVVIGLALYAVGNSGTSETAKSNDKNSGYVEDAYDITKRYYNGFSPDSSKSNTNKSNK